MNVAEMAVKFNGQIELYNLSFQLIRKLYKAVTPYLKSPQKLSNCRSFDSPIEYKPTRPPAMDMQLVNSRVGQNDLEGS